MTTILLTRRMLAGDIAYIRTGLDSQIPGEYNMIIPDDFSEESLCGLACGADIFLGPFVTPKMIEAAPDLKLIQIPWTGVETFDFSAVKDKGIVVCNTHSNAEAVAELGVALIFDLLKKVSYHDRKMRAGSWNREQIPLDLSSAMISGKKVCIIGCGAIGSRVAALLKACGCSVVAVKKSKALQVGLDQVYMPDEINAAVSDADIVVSAVPLTPQTQSLINGQLISVMKDGVRIVNLSRAKVIDEDALYSALLSGKVAGFASDVWWNPPPRGESLGYPSVRNDFTKLENVILSPHRAGFVEGKLPHLDGAIENIVHFCRGEQPNYVVSVTEQY